MRMFEEISSNEEKFKWFGYEVINEIINNGGNFTPYAPSGLKIHEIDSPKDVKIIKSIGVIS